MRKGLRRFVTLLVCLMFVPSACSTSSGQTDTTDAEQNEEQTTASVQPDISDTWMIMDDIDHGVEFVNGTWTRLFRDDSGSYTPGDDDPVWGYYEMSDEPDDNGYYTLTLYDEDRRLADDKCSTGNQDACTSPDSTDTIGSNENNQCIDNCDIPAYERLYVNTFEIVIEDGEDEATPDTFRLKPVLTDRDMEQIADGAWESDDNDHYVYTYQYHCDWQRGLDLGYSFGYDEPDSGDCVIDTDTWDFENTDVAAFSRTA